VLSESELLPDMLENICLVPSRFQRGERKTRKNYLLGTVVGRAKKNYLSISHHALPGNDITATDLYRLQLHCTVPNEGPAEEAGKIYQMYNARRN
jgi:hypothetical protein